MNPHDAAQRPGAHLVAETLGVMDIWTLNIAYQPSEPLYRAATRVMEAAHELDEVHGRVTHAAQAALEMLEPVGRGEFNGSPGSSMPLRSAVRQIEQLVSRQNAAYERLNESIFAYRHLQSETDTSQTSNAKTSDPDNDLGSGRVDDWAISGDRQLRALEAVEAGALRFHRSAVYGYVYLSDGRGQRPIPEVWPETVQRLVADGLLDQHTSKGLYRPGQLLSLTPQGEAALRAARTAMARVSAAISRSDSAALPGAGADSSAAPATSTSPKPSRSR
ncbi:large ATP-binding protein [Streptomyces gibsoniae]|uniref:Large ATP-binding protein n=1 Tax=Streptomyces gibsoniae TaxID=3075529 RepID=A0ABU2TV27_9ACTN|nr:large ATP-binding protein [Streptomyces sp. DSM 41699]MDT0464769.1 large ATP-binding protein [Streptomyces sp. DSM 41699]